MNSFLQYFKSSIGKKQIVAVTGLSLILFIIGHLAGNLFFFFGPDAFNSYAEHLANLRPALYAVEAGLAVVFFIHIWMTVVVVIENRMARPVNYAMIKPVGKRSWATRLMPYTGTIIAAFVIWHLLDFTFSDHHGVRNILADGKSYGLYGVVYNAFSDPIHSALYVIAMIALGLHLSHAIQSFAQTFGLNHPKYTPMVEKLSNGLGFLIAATFSSIPVYVLLQVMT